MPIIKTLSKATKAERDKFRIPRSVQDAIPIRRIWSDGIFQVGNQFSKTFSFTDINYQIAGKEGKTAMFLDYSELLNALDSGASAKITINNRRLNKAEFEAALLLPMRQDGLDHFRKEYNDMLLSKVTGTSNSVVQERYITISVVKKNIAEARAYFSRVGTDLITHLAQLSSIGQELDLVTRLRIFRDFFKGAEPPAFEFDLKTQMKQGHSFKDWLCPDSMEFQPDHFKLNDRWGRVLYLQGYASYIKDSMVSELCELDRDLMLSIDILPVPTDEAVREVQNKLLGVETNAANWQRRQNAANNFSATELCLIRKESGSLTTPEKPIRKQCPNSTCSAVDSLVRHSASLALEKDSEIPEGPCSLSLPDWLKPGSLAICCLKMFPDCLIMTAAGRLRRSSICWSDWGILWNGRCLTARILASPNPAAVCTLSDI